MNEATRTWSMEFDLLDQQVDFQGIFRPTHKAELQEVFDRLVDLHDRLEGTMRLNFRRLRYMNAQGIKVLCRFILHAKEARRLKVVVIASAVLAWSERVLPNLGALWDEVEFVVHDKDFYRSQGIIEDTDFIPLLRNQTRILWPLEKQVLKAHGLEKGMRVADICCGCGDVPLLISRELHPRYILGVDHSEAAMDYARNLQTEFRIHNAEFQRGDATALLLPDDSFDFVLCRLSLQIFSKPEEILRELVRITRPGGRIYTLCEDYDLIVGCPEDELIRQTYRRAAEYGDAMGMDLRSGKKLKGMLERCRLEDLRLDHLVVDTVNTDPAAFARVIESWRVFSVDTIGETLKLAPEDRATLEAGYQAHLRTLRDPQGYCTWTMVACSGRKPSVEEPV